MINWKDSKTAIAEITDLSRDALHVYVALLIFLAACLMFRWKPTSWKPWLLVLAAQTFNECMDMRSMLSDDGVIQIWASVKDMINTMIAPTLLMVAARLSGAFNQPPEHPKTPDAKSDD